MQPLDLPLYIHTSYWLSNSLSSFPALKKGTFLAGTATVAPVFGLRPSFMRRDRRRKLPNPRISVLSPFFSESLTQSKIVFTTISAWRFVSVVTCSETRSIICALVIRIPLSLGRAAASRSDRLKRHEVFETHPRIEVQLREQRREPRLEKLPDGEPPAWLDDLGLTFNPGQIGRQLNRVIQIA